MLSDGKAHSNIDLDQSSNESNESEGALANLVALLALLAKNTGIPQ